MLQDLVGGNPIVVIIVFVVVVWVLARYGGGRNTSDRDQE
jgi:hypothetical protein